VGASKERPATGSEVCVELIDGADRLEGGMSDQAIARYRARADECRAQAEHARYVTDKEAWMKLAADWTNLAADVERRRARR
jgi:hypothetical protein